MKHKDPVVVFVTQITNNRTLFIGKFETTRMWFLLMMTLSSQKEVYLKDIGNLTSILPNCDAKYNLPGVPGKLVGLVAIFRHGDRAPLNIKKNDWKAKSCIVCSDICRSQGCTDGMLTKKGYLQAKKLGMFIKKKYLPYINMKTLKAYHSDYERSISTLHGVLAGMDERPTSIAEEKSIVSSYNVKVLKKIILGPKMSGIRRKNPGDYTLYDKVISHYCSDVPFECSEFNCNPMKILSFVKRQQDDFIEYTNLIRANLISMGITLGEFGTFLQKILNARNTVTLVSGHDSLIVKVLSGLNIEVKKFPPYTSTIFIEVWQTDREFIRVVYDGEIQKTGLYKEEYITFNNFMKYLEMYTNVNSKVRPLLKTDVRKLHSSADLSRATDKIYKAYAPLISTIQRNGVKIVSITGNSPTKQVADDGDIGNDLYTATTQFLFENPGFNEYERE